MRKTYASALRAFSLVELIVGTAIGMLTLGAVVLALLPAINSYAYGEAHSKTLNALRFTETSFRTAIYPRLTSTTKVKILHKAEVPAKVTVSDDNYIFLKDDALTLRSAKGDFPLAGSEFIRTLKFTVPKNLTEPKEVYRNYILTMDFTASANSDYQNSTVATRTAHLETALLNSPEKEGSSIENISGSQHYAGDALCFKATAMTTNFSVLVRNLHISDKENINGEFSDNSYIEKGKTLKAWYETYPSTDPGYAVADASTCEWYIAASTSAKVENIMTSDPAQLTEAARDSGFWLLTSESGIPCTGTELATKGNFYIKTARGIVKWDTGIPGVIRCRILPALKSVANPSLVTDGDPAWTPFIILKLTKKNSFFDDMKNAILQYGNKQIQDEAFPVTTKTVKVSWDGSESNDSYIQIAKGNTLGSTVMGKVTMHYLKESIEASQEDGFSCTSPTNYSVIIDTKLSDKTSGWGLLINGTAEKRNNSYMDSGYMLQYDSGAEGFPLRFMLFSTEKGNVDAGNNDNGAFGVENIDVNEYFTGKRSTYGPYYGPGYLKNSLFTFSSGNGSAYIKSDIRARSFPWTVRQTVMVTLLEFYTTDITRPQYILRFKYLKKLETGAEDSADPFGCGEKYFYSNPAWYGNFKGQNYTQKLQNNYLYPIYSYGPCNGNTYSTTKTKQELYLTKSQVSQNPGDSSTCMGVFGARALDVRATTAKYSTNSSLFTDTKRGRYLGFRVWSTSAEDSTRVYDVRLAPGFTKTELQAILPAQAKLYDYKDIIPAEEYEAIKKSPVDYGLPAAFDFSKSLNTRLFSTQGSSDGNGNGSGITNGVAGIQYQLLSNGTKGTWYGYRPSAAAAAASLKTNALYTVLLHRAELR